MPRQAVDTRWAPPEAMNSVGGWAWRGVAIDAGGAIPDHGAARRDMACIRRGERFRAKIKGDVI
jgi:hypothetical protein